MSGKAFATRAIVQGRNARVKVIPLCIEFGISDGAGPGRTSL